MITWHQSSLKITGQKDNIKKFILYLVKQKLTKIKNVTIATANNNDNEIHATCLINSFDISFYQNWPHPECGLYTLHVNLEKLKEQFNITRIDLLLSAASNPEGAE